MTEEQTSTETHDYIAVPGAVPTVSLGDFFIKDLLKKYLENPSA